MRVAQKPVGNSGVELFRPVFWPDVCRNNGEPPFAGAKDLAEVVRADLPRIIFRADVVDDCQVRFDQIFTDAGCALFQSVANSWPANENEVLPPSGACGGWMLPTPSANCSGCVCLRAVGVPGKHEQGIGSNVARPAVAKSLSGVSQSLKCGVVAIEF